MNRRLFFGKLAAAITGTVVASHPVSAWGVTEGARVGAIMGAISHYRGPIYFGHYTSENDFEMVGPLDAFEPGALARAIERLKVRG